MNTQYPLRAKHTKSDLVVEFVSEKSGKVIVPNPGWSNSSMLADGGVVNCWGSCFDTSLWTIAAEPASNENKPENNNTMNNIPFALPPKWFIRTLDPALSAAIQTKLFKLGLIWGDEKVPVQYTDNPILFSNEKKYFYRIVNSDDLVYYKDFVEITIEQLFSLSPAPKEIEFEIAGYKGTATADSIKVGCQEMTMANYKEVRKEIEEYRKPKPYKVIDTKFKDRWTDITLSPQGINLTSSSLGNIHLEYKEFDELDKILNRG